MVSRSLALAGVAVGALLFAGTALGSPRTGGCSTHGLSFSGVRVVSLQVQGLSCSAARSVAGKVAHDVLHGRPISVASAAGLSVSEESCTGCRTTTDVAIAYRRGKVTLALRGGAGMPASAPSIPGPAFSPGSTGPVV